jgi:hypothetical protein
MALPPKKGKGSLSGGKGEDGASSEGTKGQAYNFRFVEVGEPSHGGNFARSTIRSHVMRDYYEKKDKHRRPSAIPGVSSVASQKEGALQQTHKFKVGPEGLREVKAGRKKGKGTSRSIKRASNIASEAPELGDLEVRAHLNLQEHAPKSPESANFASANHWEPQRLGVSFEYDQWFVAESGIVIGDAQFPAQTEADSRNIAPPENISSISGAIDPFDTLPVLCVPSSEHLLHHGKNLAALFIRSLLLSVTLVAEKDKYHHSALRMCLTRRYSNKLEMTNPIITLQQLKQYSLPGSWDHFAPNGLNLPLETEPSSMSRYRITLATMDLLEQKGTQWRQCALEWRP